MRIAFLCKRRYMGKDVILDRYARLYEIPYQLARQGHTVRGYCFGYQGQEGGHWAHDAKPGQLDWVSVSAAPLLFNSLWRYPFHLLAQLREFGPDLLIGASDIPHVALTGWLARRLGVPYAVDLYDNFEGFGQARIPGFVSVLRKATRGASLVTTTSEPLRRLVLEEYAPQGNVVAMPSTVDKAIFQPLDKTSARQELGLPATGWLIGTAGGLYRDKGITTLYEAWARIAAAHPEAHLVLAGPHDQAPPDGPRVHYLGQLAHAQTAKLFNALDLGVIYLRDTPFGRYCFPQKAYEMMACGLPLVAARIGVMTDLLAGTPESLYVADDAIDLARAVMATPRHASQHAPQIDDWAKIIGQMGNQLKLIAGQR